MKYRISQLETLPIGTAAVLKPLRQVANLLLMENKAVLLDENLRKTVFSTLDPMLIKTIALNFHTDSYGLFFSSLLSVGYSRFFLLFSVSPYSCFFFFNHSFFLLLHHSPASNNNHFLKVFELDLTVSLEHFPFQIPKRELQKKSLILLLDYKRKNKIK